MTTKQRHRCSGVCDWVSVGARRNQLFAQPFADNRRPQASHHSTNKGEAVFHDKHFAWLRMQPRARRSIHTEVAGHGYVLFLGFRVVVGVFLLDFVINLTI